MPSWACLVPTLLVITKAKVSGVPETPRPQSLDLSHCWASAAEAPRGPSSPGHLLGFGAAWAGCSLGVLQ